MRILNLYSGIGGNRQLWTDCDVVAVERDPVIADLYRQYYPDDDVIVGDAHNYLREHYKEYNFIWSSPPCPTHSDIRRMGVHSGQYDALYPDMTLYQEIILLKHFARLDCKWVVENVRPYYVPLIPGKLLGRHLFWSNFGIPDADIDDDRVTRHNDIYSGSTIYGRKIPSVPNARKILRNQVNPKLGEYILNVARGIKMEQFNQIELNI